MNIPRSALLLELGWEPITAFIDRSKGSYFKRLSELPDSRLCKQVYNKMMMLNDTFWNYVNEIQSICMGSDPTNQNFSRKYSSITRDRLLLDVTNKYSSIARDRLLLDVTNKYSSITRDRLLLDVTNKSSLDLYQYFYIKQSKQVYLDNQNDFKASRLKLLARTKTIPLQKYLCRMNLWGNDLPFM
jgi:hypothetical protein